MNTDLFLSLYNKGLTDSQIAKESGFSAYLVRIKRRSLGLSYNNLIDNHRDKIIELSNLNLTNSEIARITGLSIVSINMYRKTNNLNRSPFIRNSFKNQQERIKGKMIVRSRSRAKKLKIDFNLNPEDIILNEYCPILNVKLDYIDKKMNNKNAASLDRIDNSKGYIKGNVMVISVLANTMKNNASIDELSLFCNNVKNILNNLN